MCGSMTTNFAPFGLDLLAGSRQFLLGDKLDIGINGKNYVPAVGGREVIFFCGGERPPAGILERPLEAVVSGERLLELHLQPFEAHPVFSHPADNMGCQRTHRVMTDGGWQRADTREVAFVDSIRD